MTQISTPAPAPATRAPAVRPGYKISSVTGRAYKMHNKSAHDPRGSARNRRDRKNWLLSAKSGFGGNGHSVKCTHCPEILTFATVQADRKIPGFQWIKIHGSAKGSYRRENVQPSCGPCNRSRDLEVDTKIHAGGGA